MRRKMRKARTQVAAIARKPSTTMTAMAHRGKPSLVESDWTFPVNAAVPVKVVGVPFIVVSLVSDATDAEETETRDAESAEAEAEDAEATDDAAILEDTESA